MWRFSHAATVTQVSKSLCALSTACVSSANCSTRTSGAPGLARSAAMYLCESTMGTLRAAQNCLLKHV